MSERRADVRQPCKCERTFFAFDVESSCGEPPRADPHAGWCGERGRETPAYPISLKPDLLLHEVIASWILLEQHEFLCMRILARLNSIEINTAR